MKLEKREITLNEKDSLQDMLFAQKNITRMYLEAIEKVRFRECRKTLIKLLAEASEDICFLCDLQKGIEEEN